jgi:hypothetical protein
MKISNDVGMAQSRRSIGAGHRLEAYALLHWADADTPTRRYAPIYPYSAASSSFAFRTSGAIFAKKRTT